MANYTVSDDSAYDGDYSAAGAGYYEWASGDIFTYYSGGSRQVYTKDGNTDKKLFYCKHFIGNDKWCWILGNPDTGYVEDFYQETADITPYVGSWADVGGYITLAEAGGPVEHDVVASTNIEFDSDAERDAMDFNLDAENDIEFDDEAKLQTLVFGENNIEFDVEADGFREISVSAETNVEFDQENHLTYEAEAENDIEFDHDNDVLRVVFGDGDSSIEFDGAVAEIRASESGFELSHSAEAAIVKPIEHNIEFSDSAIREPMEFNRAASNDIEFDDAGSGYNANDPAHGPCDDEYTCDRDHITLDCTDPVITVDLRNPQDDSLHAILNIINRYSRGEELRVTGVHPRFLQLHYQFTSMPASQKAAFITFFKATAGLEITLMDFCSQRWIGCIIDKEITFNREEGRTNTDPSCPEPDDGLYSWEFTFEGERIPDTFRSWGDLIDTYEYEGYGYLKFNVGLDDWEFVEGGSHKYSLGVDNPDTALIWLDWSAQDPDYRDFEYGWGIMLIESRSGLPDHYMFDAIESSESNPPTMEIWSYAYGIMTVNDTTTYYYFIVGTGSGTLIGDLNQVVAAGENTSEVEVIPLSGETFGYWAINGGGVLLDNPLTVLNMSSNMQIAAQFEPPP